MWWFAATLREGGGEGPHLHLLHSTMSRSSTYKQNSLPRSWHTYVLNPCHRLNTDVTQMSPSGANSHGRVTAVVGAVSAQWLLPPTPHCGWGCGVIGGATVTVLVSALNCRGRPSPRSARFHRGR